MKLHIHSLATTTSFFFLLLVLVLLSATTTEGGNFLVYDGVGDPVVAGGEYRIIPYDYSPNGGGFTWKENRKLFSPCPEFNIIQINDGTNFGLPISFKPIDTQTKKITLSTPVNIIFPEVSPPKGLPVICSSSSNVWKVVRDEVELGGRKGNNGNSVFTIEYHEYGGYKINYCPNTNSNVGCGSLGIDIRDGQRRLVINNARPLSVVFSSEITIVDNKYAAV